ncbi:MAG TPA: tetratricopeptide repeat protein, partial [Candidatus Ozemobacteraceae bacterium]|nr:tetratricopeptide repeat protein [Candidatus Ozemobacteraceae bacterium]
MVKRLLLSACCLLLLYAPVASAQTRYQKAMAAFASGKLEVGVKEYYASILLEDPYLSPSCKQRDLEGAEKHFQLKLDQASSRDWPAFYLALVKRLKGDLQTGHGLVDEVRGRHPKSRILTFVKGEFLLAAEQYEEANRAFAHLATDRKSVSLVKLARHLQNRYGQATASSESRRRLLEQSYRFFDLGDYERAEKAMREFQTRFPDDMEGTGFLLEILLAQDRATEAGTLHDLWKKQYGRSPLPPMREANLAYLLARFDRANELLIPMLAAQPDNDHARSLLAESLFQQGGYASASVHFAQLL